MRVYVDSDILIWHLRGKDEARQRLKKLTDDNDVELWIGAMQRAEIVFFMRDTEKEYTMDLLSLFKTHPVDKTIIDQAGEFYRKWNPSHGIDPDDAILAATVALTGGRIITQNISHYPMPDIIVQKGW
jgi:predicted nucleic acid-binding protein